MGNFVSDNPLVLLIAACEIGFWVLLAAGLTTRYLFRARRTSAVLLLLVPVLDVVLIGASLVDVAGGSPPGLTHGVAAVYLGFTVGFGHATIRWADARIAHRFAGGPAPVPPPRHGPAKVAHEWREWGRLALGWTVAMVVIAVTAAVAGTGVPALPEWGGDPMWSWGLRIGVVAVFWLIAGPLWTSLFPPRAPDGADARG